MALPPLRFYLKDYDDEFPDDFKQLFVSARKAIECGNVKKFISSLDGLKSVSDCCAIKDRFLDVCARQIVVSRHTRLRCHYFTSLLAYAGINNQKEMVDILIKRKACTWISSKVTGSPMTQMMIYCLHHGCPEMINEKIIKCSIDSIPEDKLTEETDGIKCSNFDQNVVFHIPDKSLDSEICSPVELAIQIQRIDIGKLLVQAGANPVCADDSIVEQILPLFIEFFEFGTNRYISWLLHEHLSQDQVAGFIESVLEKKDIIFSSYAKQAFKDQAGRHHVHAVLTCGHEGMIKKFISRFPADDDGQKTLKAMDSAERTALQVAAGNGDLESVTTLINMYTQWIDQGDGVDIARALLAAAKGNHVKVVEIILRMDDDAFRDKTRYSVLRVKLNGVETWKIAVQEGLSCIFEVLRHYDQIIIAERFDDEGNTLGHITAKSGNVDLFKVVFPLQKQLPLSLVKESLQSKTNYSMFWALVLENESNDTPLMVAIDNNNPNILESLQERAVERELRQNAKQNKEKTEWEHFWRDHGERLLVHACSCGSSRSLDCVRVLINITKSTLGLLPQRWTVDAFQACTKAGNDDVVNYFLQNFQTFISQELKDKALLEVADFGHHRCVRILLKHGADIKAKDKSDGNNCLMKAIEKNHREAVLTILSDETFGPESLRFVRKRTHWHIWKRLRKIEYTQPLILLIKHMPEIAEWVLNKCALSKPPQFVQNPTLSQGVVIADEPESNSSHHQVSLDETDFGGGLERLISLEDDKVQRRRDYIMENSFELLEEPDENSYTTGNGVARVRIFRTVNSFSHPIQTMVDYDRAEMLNHNLVQTWIDHKLRDVIPDLIIYVILYLMFLAILTIFALLLPRPGPWNQYCYLSQTVMMVNTTNMNETSTDGQVGNVATCEGQSRHLVNAFYFSAVVLILSSLAYLVLEVAQFCHRLHRYLLEIENYVQVLMYISVIIFAFPFGQNSCWCLPAWKWQIGALALFLAWLNLLLLIRYIPWLNVGQHSTMLFNVYLNFLKLIYLPILILVTFAIPLYMLLVDSTPTEGREATSPLAVFSTPFTTLYNTIFQTAGEIDGNGVIKSSLHYEVASYVLFLVFVIAVPILFNNFLIGMAVGETQVEKNKAYLSLTKRKIYYIFEVQNVLYRKVIPYITSKCRKRMSIRELKLKANDENVREFRAKDKAIKDDIKSKTRAKSTKRKVKRLALLMTQNETTLNSHKVELEQSLRMLGTEVSDIKNEMAGIKDSVATMKEMIHQLCVSKDHKERETDL